MRSDRCEELAPSGRPRVDHYEAGVHVVVRFSMYKQNRVIVVRNTAFTVWEWSTAAARRSLRSGQSIDRGSVAEISQTFLKECRRPGATA
jgi:hypothetical protein